MSRSSENPLGIRLACHLTHLFCQKREIAMLASAIRLVLLGILPGFYNHRKNDSEKQ
jgi:hypothetical protein